MIAFFLLVLAVYSLHGIVVLTWDVLSFPYKIVGVASYFRTPIVPLSLAIFSVVLHYFCVFQLLWSLYVSLHFLFYFLRCIHTVTLHGVASSQVSVFFLWRGRKSPLPRISILWPRELCPEELYTDGRHLVCSLCC